MDKLIEQFNQYSVSQKFLFVIVAAALIFGVYYMLLYSPVQDDIKNQESQLQQLQAELEKLDQVKSTRAAKLAKLESLQRELMIAREKLPENAEIPSLLQRIHNQAKTAGLDINSFRRLENVEKDYFIEIPVSMELVGTFDELANFFYYIGRMTRIVNVRDVTVARSEKGLSEEGELAVEAMATTFQYKSPEPNAQGAQAQNP